MTINETDVMKSPDRDQDQMNSLPNFTKPYRNPTPMPLKLLHKVEKEIAIPDSSNKASITLIPKTG